MTYENTFRKLFRMSNPIVDVFSNGAVRLGRNVICDGFVDLRYSYRVQTHIHDDHMADFDRSKGFQNLVMSQGTYRLLIAERNADLEYRENFYPVEYRERFEIQDGSTVSLIPSNHMLGSSQVLLELPTGRRVGYSGDFGWPLNEVIQVEELVVDSTYGSPNSVRHYSQESAEARLQEIVCQSLRKGPVHIKAHRGTIERVLHILSSDVAVPVLASKRLIKSARVYQNYGFAVGQLEEHDSCTGRTVQLEQSYVRLYSKGDSWGNTGPDDGTTIVCSAFMVSPHDPCLEITNRSYKIGLSNHADFNETMEYIEATGAKVVVTDNTRQNGIKLAETINERLTGVLAVPSTNADIPIWS